MRRTSAATANIAVAARPGINWPRAIPGPEASGSALFDNTIQRQQSERIVAMAIRPL
jgi:hypothetical protein